MNPVPIPDEAREANPQAAERRFGPPEGVSLEECGFVDVLIDTASLGGEVSYVLMSYFRPTAEELAVLNAGGYLEVAQYGQVLQPFAVEVLRAGNQAEPYVREGATL